MQENPITKQSLNQELERIIMGKPKTNPNSRVNSPRKRQASISERTTRMRSQHIKSQTIDGNQYVTVDGKISVFPVVTPKVDPNPRDTYI